MASGSARVVTGSLLGTGASRDVKTVGFRPKKVVVTNITGSSEAQLEWTDAMPDASAVKTAAAGTRTFITTLGITPLADGFTLGADTDVNVDTEKVYWEAWG